MDEILLCCPYFEPPCKPYPKSDVLQYWEEDGKRFVTLNGTGQLEVVETIDYLREALGKDRERK